MHQIDLSQQIIFSFCYSFPPPLHHCLNALLSLGLLLFFFFFNHFPTSKELDGLTGWALETASSLQTHQTLLPHWTIVCPNFLFFFFSIATMKQAEHEWKEWGLQWKQHLVSDSCLLKRQKEKRKQKQRKRKSLGKVAPSPQSPQQA